MQADIAKSAELDLAGCLLVYPQEVYNDICSIVSADDFINPIARSIYEATQSLINSGQAADPTLIIARTSERGESVPTDYAFELMKRCVTTANVTITAELVHNAAMDRAGADVGAALTFGQIDTLEAITKLQELVSRQSVKILSPLEAANNLVDYVNAASSGEFAPFISTGFDSLDKQLSGGFVQSGLITLAARPGTGKTTAALNLAEKVAERAQTVLYFSLEMDYKQLWARRAGAYSGLSYSNIYRGNLDEQHYKRFLSAVDMLSKNPFHIFDKPCSIEEIEKVVRGSKPLPALVVIDHIGLIKNNAGRSRYELMTDTVHRLKQIALSTGVPILALCQLNRQSEARESKTPTVADLRDTGAIEEDSDVVMLLHRPAMYADEENKPKPWEEQELQVIVGKNRHGMQGAVKLGFIGMTARITESPPAS